MNGRPKRVLQVVRAMNRGGVETWLMHIVRSLDPRRLQLDFLVHTSEPADYNRELQGRGSRLIPCTVSWRTPSYAMAIRGVLRQFGPYDVIHSHVHHFSGLLLSLARVLNVPVRIAHSHSDTSRQDEAAGWLRRRYLQCADAGIGRCATHWVAASRAAGQALFGLGWENDARSQVLHCGIDLRPYGNLRRREDARAELGIERNDVVIGHVGRFEAPKNHAFLVQVAADAVRRWPNLRLVLVGEGSFRKLIEDQVQALGLGPRTLFLGARADVPHLLPAMDAFVFPSLWEGLPLTVVEAQAAGLPCLISDCISTETDVVPELVQRMGLSEGAGAWADALTGLIGGPRLSQAAALACVESSDFDIHRCLEGLYALYAV